MRKEIKVVCGLIYDDEFHARTGGTRFYHLNGDIETNADGEQVYVCTKQNQQGKFEDITEPVSIFAQGKISIQVSLRIYPSL